ncbi:MAG: beta-glucosidase [Mucilaginibacter sp.]|nr:beta-glucosidase [Mucilaginibacter sp.]
MNKYKSRYIDSPNEPLYPFGYGLSYTTFSYSPIKLNTNVMNNAGNIRASITVSNTGDHDGEEVVQMYIQDIYGSITRPVKELKGFQKIFLKKGESKVVTFNINVNDLKFYNADLKYTAEPGDFKIFIGTNSSDVIESKFKLVTQTG